jgi:protein SCO1/2
VLGLLLAWACNSAPTYILEGTVVEVRATQEIVVDHREIPGLMPAMIMPFPVSDPALLAEVRPGTQIVGRLEIGQQGAQIVKLRVTGQGPPPLVAPAVDPHAPVAVGTRFPTFSVPTADDGVWTVGDGQAATLVTFLYTRCPIPEACPTIVARLQAVAAALSGSDARLLAVTLDPDHDTLEVLRDFGSSRGAASGRLAFARLDPEPLRGLTERAALRTLRTGDAVAIDHGIRFLVIGRDGTLIERYDDARFPLDRVVSQLTTGGPLAPAGSDGTLTP